jgi:inner membrane protein
MDSVTQIVLGAAVGEATLGKQVGRHAWVWGAACGLFPDLDVFFPYADAVKRFTYHRGPSHSIFVLTALTPLFVWLILKLHPHAAKYRGRWMVLVFLAFTTHILLDCLTVYGTQIFWPFAGPPVMWSTVFIIDPLYSFPLFFGVAAALVTARKRSWGYLANRVGLILSTTYLVWTVGTKVYVTHIAYASLKQQNVTYQRMLTTPTPFNTLLWRVLAMDEKGYYEGFFSIFDGTRQFQVTYYPSDQGLLAGMADHWPVKRLQWFTHGFYSVRQQMDDIVMTDLRMGLEPSYIFQFKVGKAGNPHAEANKSKRVVGKRGWDSLTWVWHRIWTDQPLPHAKNAGSK